MFIRKIELVQAIKDFDQSKRWYNPSTYDDEPIIILRKFVLEYLSEVSGDSEISFSDFIQYANEYGKPDLINESYLQSPANSKYIFLTWQQNTKLDFLPAETWCHIMRFLRKSDFKKLVSTCHYFHRYDENKTLFDSLPIAEHDYTQIPKITTLPEIDVITCGIKDDYLYAVAYKKPKWYQNRDNILYVLNIRTGEIVRSHVLNIHRIQNVSLHFLESGNLLLINGNGKISLIDPVTGKLTSLNQFLDLPAAFNVNNLQVWPEKNSLVFNPTNTNQMTYYPVNSSYPNQSYVINAENGEFFYAPLDFIPTDISVLKIENNQCFYINGSGSELPIILPDGRKDATLFYAKTLPTGDILYGYALHNEDADYYHWKIFYIARFPELKCENKIVEEVVTEAHRCRLM